MANRSTIPVAIIVGGVIIAATVYISAPKMPKGELPPVPPITADDHILGNPTAPVVIIEYTDFDCEFCSEFHTTLHHIIANDGADGSVAWVLRHYPLTEVHPNTLALARAAECAREVAGNEAFWRFSDTLFARQPVSLQNLGSLAAEADIPGEAFAACYANPPQSIIDRITNDRKDAQMLGAEGTPFSILLVAGRVSTVMAEAYPYDIVKQLVDQVQSE